MNNFTPRAQQVLALARKEADRFNHNYVGTEHLLLGLIKLGQGVAVNVLQKRLGTLLDQIGRAFGVLTHAYSMTSKEALNLLSFMKLGVDLGFFPDDNRPVIDELFMETQPAHLQKSSQQKLQVEERDALRAGIIREKLKQFPEPDVGHPSETGNGNSEKPDDE